jgi:hypothetical protein
MGGVFLVVTAIALFRPDLVLRIMYGSQKLSMRAYARRGLQVAAGLSLAGILYCALMGRWL